MKRTRWIAPLTLSALAALAALASGCGGFFKEPSTEVDFGDVDPRTLLEKFGVLAPGPGSFTSFGAQTVGSQTDLTVTLLNYGGGKVSAIEVDDDQELSDPFSYKGGSYPGTGGTCDESLDSGASCTLVLTYEPTSEGLHEDRLALSYVNGALRVDLELPVSGTTSGVLTFDAGTGYYFGSIDPDHSADHTVTVTNTDAGAVSDLEPSSSHGIAAPFGFKGGTYPGTGGTCGSTLAGLATCTLVLTYRPDEYGAYADRLILSFTHGATSKIASLDLAGNSF